MPVISKPDAKSAEAVKTTQKSGGNTPDTIKAMENKKNKLWSLATPVLRKF